MDHLEDSDSEAAVRDPPSEAIREDTEEAATLQVDEGWELWGGEKSTAGQIMPLKLQKMGAELNVDCWK